MKNRPRILFLYTEIANYFLACINELHKTADIAIVRWPINKEAPFQFEFHKDWIIRERDEMNKNSLIDFSNEFKPDILVCSGWVDPVYNATAKYWFKKIPTLLALDNHYTGSFRQQLGRLASPFKLKNRFSDVWVPGKPQFEFALKLGYKPKQILKGFYSADVGYFNSIYKETFPQKEKKFPNRFIYMGRYLGFKGIFEMWEAFIGAIDETGNQSWELWCLGTGDEWESRVNHPKIKHFGFVQTADLKDILKNSGVFVLPSHREPWGVVVHEMAVAGFPLICSNKIGASSQFLVDGKNGMMFPATDSASLKEVFIRFMRLPQKQQITMGKESHRLGMEHTPEKWSATLLGMIRDSKV